jgi:hypothetical protein
VTDFFRYVATAGIIAAAVGHGAAFAQPATAGAFKAPRVPFNIEVPEGNALFLKGEAHGTQNYICLPSASGFAWTFFSPQATLFFTFRLAGREFSQQIITHFLSPNPAEKGTSRATWQSSLDSSAVWARVAQDGSSSDPSFVAPGAIPWLLLEQVGRQRGPTGGDILANTTFIQRVNTAGGIAPSTGCSSTANVGATALVPYRADYFFYKKSSGK